MNDENPEFDDQQITEAYVRLGTALAPPPDIAVRVERRVVVRRRRRRTALAGAAALVVAAAVGGAVAFGSGGDPDGDTIATDRPGPQGSFVLTRPDGSTYEFSDLTVTCDKTPSGDKVEPGKILLYSPFDSPDGGESLKAPFLFFEAVVAKADGKTFTLPDDRGGSPDEVFVLFAADPKPSGKPGNEVSSAQPGAAGTVRVLHASCDPSPVLELEVDTTLGSELEQGTQDLVGSFG